MDLDVLRTRVADLAQQATRIEEAASEYAYDDHSEFGRTVAEVDDQIAVLTGLRRQISDIARQIADVQGEALAVYNAASELGEAAAEITDLTPEAEGLDEEIAKLQHRREVLAAGGEKGLPRSHLPRKERRTMATKMNDNDELGWPVGSWALAVDGIDRLETALRDMCTSAAQGDLIYDAVERAGNAFLREIQRAGAKSAGRKGDVIWGRFGNARTGDGESTIDQEARQTLIDYMDEIRALQREDAPDVEMLNDMRADVARVVSETDDEAARGAASEMLPEIDKLIERGMAYERSIGKSSRLSAAKSSRGAHGLYA